MGRMKGTGNLLKITTALSMIASNILPFASVRGVIQVYPLFAVLPTYEGFRLGFDITVQYFPFWFWLCFFACVAYALVKDNEAALTGFFFGVAGLLMESTLLRSTLGNLVQVEIGLPFIVVSLVLSLVIYETQKVSYPTETRKPQRAHVT